MKLRQKSFVSGLKKTIIFRNIPAGAVVVPVGVQRREIDFVKSKEICIGSEYYDEFNGEYIHFVGCGSGKGVFQCEVYSYFEDDGYVLSGLFLLYDYEINHYKLVKRGGVI